MTHIDRVHAAHADGRGHSSLSTTMKLCAMLNASKKLDTVTTSLTETKVVTTSEICPKCA